MASINYDIPADLHRLAKSTAAAQGLTLKAFLIKALWDAVGAHRGKTG